jgi:hypothetical protein
LTQGAQIQRNDARLSPEDDNPATYMRSFHLHHQYTLASRCFLQAQP